MMGRTREQIQADLEQFAEQHKDAWDRSLERVLNAPEMSDAEVMATIDRDRQAAKEYWKRWEDDVRHGAPIGRIDPPNCELYERFLELRSPSESR